VDSTTGRSAQKRALNSVSNQTTKPWHSTAEAAMQVLQVRSAATSHAKQQMLCCTVTAPHLSEAAGQGPCCMPNVKTAARTAFGRMQNEVRVELNITSRHGGEVEALEFGRGGHHRTSINGGHACGAAGQRLGADFAAHSRKVKAVYVVPKEQPGALLS